MPVWSNPASLAAPSSQSVSGGQPAAAKPTDTSQLDIAAKMAFAAMTPTERRAAKHQQTIAYHEQKAAEAGYSTGGNPAAGKAPIKYEPAPWKVKLETPPPARVDGRAPTPAQWARMTLAERRHYQQTNGL